MDNSTITVSKSKNSGNIDTSKSHDEWETPDSLFNKLNNEFEFNYDLACNSENCKCIDGSKIDIGKNGLDFNPDEYRQNKVNKKIQSKDYLTIWCNPPYNRIDKPKFIKKCFDLSQHPRVDTVVMLIPSKTSTGDFHDIILPNAEIRWLRGRPKFKGINYRGKYVTQNAGRNDCMIVIFR